MLPFHVPRALRDFPKSYVLLSSEDACDRLAIFVHGFGGGPSSTWQNFQGLIDDLSSDFPTWRKTDLCFYSYDSKRAVQVNSQDFSAFMETVIEGEIEQIAPSDFPFKPTFLENKVFLAKTTV